MPRWDQKALFIFFFRANPPAASGQESQAKVSKAAEPAPPSPTAAAAVAELKRYRKMEMLCVLHLCMFCNNI